MPICGAKTNDGKQCRNRVPEAGHRCHVHSKHRPNAIWSTILTICTTVATIAETAEGVHWIYQHAWPHIEPLLKSGLFCPERFWWDNLAEPIQRGEPPTKIHSKSKAVLKQMRRDDEDIKDELARYSERDRERIVNAYSKVFSEIRKYYPHLSDAASTKSG